MWNIFSLDNRQANHHMNLLCDIILLHISYAIQDVFCQRKWLLAERQLSAIKLLS